MRVALLGNFQVPWCTEVAWAGSFELNGHEVTRIQEGETRAVDVPDLAAGHDLFLWVQTYGLAVSGGTVEERTGMLDRIRAEMPTVAAHLDKWWDLPRADQLAGEPYFRCDFVFTADGGNEDRWESIGVNHVWMPPAVYEPECKQEGRRRPEYVSPVAFVGNWRDYHPEWSHRMALVEWLRRRYGQRVNFWPRGQSVRGQALNDLYASVDVAVGDSCMVGGTGYYWSDRIPETLGRGGFLLHPYTTGLKESYEPGVHLDCWDLGDWDRLRVLIDHYLDHPDERQAIAQAGREHVLAEHTYTVRVRQIIERVGGEAAAFGGKSTGTGGVAMIETRINGRWSLLLPEHRAARPEWEIGWERERWDSLHANIVEGDTVLDIGTEEGDLSALLAQWVGPDGTVCLFEPNPAVWPNIRAIMEGNGLAERVRWWVGFAGPENRFLDGEAWGVQGRWPRCAYGPLIGDHGFCVLHQRPDLPAVTVDWYCEKHGLRPDVITMDVEGAELEVLHGAGRVLTRDHPLVYVSVHPEFMRDEFNRDSRELWTFMGDLGYEPTELAVDHEQHVVWSHPDRPLR